MHPQQLTVEQIEAAFLQATKENNELMLALANECLYHRRKRKAGEILAESGVSLGTGEPFVRLTWFEQEAQLHPSIAKSFGQSVIDAAYSAEHDAYFCAWLQQAIGMKREQAAAALGGLREMREREDKRPPS
jgi:hypothetical protein